MSVITTSSSTTDAADDNGHHSHGHSQIEEEVAAFMANELFAAMINNDPTNSEARNTNSTTLPSSSVESDESYNSTSTSGGNASEPGEPEEPEEDTKNGSVVNVQPSESPRTEVPQQADATAISMNSPPPASSSSPVLRSSRKRAISEDGEEGDGGGGGGEKRPRVDKAEEAAGPSTSREPKITIVYPTEAPSEFIFCGLCYRLKTAGQLDLSTGTLNEGRCSFCCRRIYPSPNVARLFEPPKFTSASIRADARKK